MDKTITKLFTLLVLIGGLHIGLLGGFGLDLLGTILGTGTLAKLVYILIGVGAAYHLFTDVSKKIVK